MKVPEALYEFTKDRVQIAAGSPLDGADVHSHIYKPYKPGKTVRIGLLEKGNPAVINGRPSIENAVIKVYFVVMPVTQKDEDIYEAYLLAMDMALEWFEAVYAKRKLEDLQGSPRVCATGGANIFNFFIRPATTITAVSAIQITVNPR